MKLQPLIGSAVFALALMLPVFTALADGCSCTASDGSCSASVDCEGGCYSYCDPGGPCDAQCTGDKRRPIQNFLHFGPAELREGPAFEGAPVEEVIQRAVTLQFDAASSLSIAPYVSNDVGARFAFVPRQVEDAVNVDVKRFPVDELVDLLGHRGGAAVASGGEIYLTARDLSSADLSRLLSEALGVTVEFGALDSHQSISLQVKATPVEEFLRILTRHGVVSFPDS
jgi:hypothetical protein